MKKVNIRNENTTLTFENIQITLKEKYSSVACRITKLGDFQEYLHLRKGIVPIVTLGINSVDILADDNAIVFCAQNHVLSIMYIGDGEALLHERIES